MLLLIIGLVLFVGMHLTRLFAEEWRSRFIVERGDKMWKGLYALVSLVGLVLIVVGYGQARLIQTWIWHPPAFLTPVSWLLTLVAFVLLAAAYVPNNPIRSSVGHPMILGVKVWAIAHLLVNGGVADLILFGSLLVWAIFLYSGSRRIDRRDSIAATSSGGITFAALTVGAGAVAWIVFAGFAHRLLIGVSPLG